MSSRRYLIHWSSSRDSCYQPPGPYWAAGPRCPGHLQRPHDISERESRPLSSPSDYPQGNRGSVVEVTGSDCAAGKEEVGFAFMSAAPQGPLCGQGMASRRRCKSLSLFIKYLPGAYHVTETSLPFVLKPDFTRQKQDSP